MTTRPRTVIDPVCGMTVDVAAADADGRIATHGDRSFAFCRHGCLRAFLEEPEVYAAQADAAAAADPAPHDHPDESGHSHAEGSDAAPTMSTVAATPVTTLVIDEGMRRWYESCSCCLSDAYPDIKAALDAERVAANAGPVDPGICEVAEAMEPTETASLPV